MKRLSIFLIWITFKRVDPTFGFKDSRVRGFEGSSEVLNEVIIC